MTSSSIFVAEFLLSSLVTGPSFLSMLWLVLESWQFLFIKDWPKIGKSEITSSEFCQISGDWGKFGIPNLSQMSLIKCYWMLQIVRVTAFATSEFWVSKRKPTGGVKLSPLLSPRLGLIRILFNSRRMMKLNKNYRIHGIIRKT